MIFRDPLMTVSRIRPNVPLFCVSVGKPKSERGSEPRGDEEVTEAGDRNDPVDVMKLLVDKGADVNAANDAGMTPMHYAVQRGVDRIIEYLASKGARFDIKNKQGRTPADLARGRTATLVKRLTQQ